MSDIGLTSHAIKQSNLDYVKQRKSTNNQRPAQYKLISKRINVTEDKTADTHNAVKFRPEKSKLRSIYQALQDRELTSLVITVVFGCLGLLFIKVFGM